MKNPALHIKRTMREILLLSINKKKQALHLKLAVHAILIIIKK